MNLWIEKTNSNDRIAISNGMAPIFDSLERAELLLDAVMEECYGSNENKWEWQMLRIVQDMLMDATTAYHLTIADTRSICVKNAIKEIENVKVSMQCEEVQERICDLARNLPAAQRKTITEERVKASDMNDEQALVILNELERRIKA